MGNERCSALVDLGDGVSRIRNRLLLALPDLGRLDRRRRRRPIGRRSSGGRTRQQIGVGVVDAGRVGLVARRRPDAAVSLEQLRVHRGADGIVAGAILW